MSGAWDDVVEAARAEPGGETLARFPGYRSGRGCLLRASELAERVGGRAEPLVFGRSAGGRPLWAVRVGSGPRRILYLANLHAMEFIGSEVVLALLEHLVAQPIDGVEVWLAPVANPDGRARAEANAAAGRRRFARANENGVDLNRNFAVGFSADYWMHRALPAIYRPGTAPFSEPETAALRDLCAAHPPHAAISFHAFGGWIFHPWACRNDPPPDARRFAEVAGRMAACMRRPYRVAQLGRWARWFRAHGAEIDYLYGTHGTLAFLMEVSRGGASAGRPGSWVDPLSWFNPPDPRPDVENVLPAALLLAGVEGAGGG
jgi:zinc carboxypeptidase